MNWITILKTVITGTERCPLPQNAAALPGFPPPPDDPAQAALEALSAANLLRKAGRKMAKQEAGKAGIVSFAEPDDAPKCSPGAALDLQQILAGRYADALPEWLALASENRLRVPPELLPTLLDHLLRHPEQASSMRPVAGQRAEWLARQNPRWAQVFATEAPDWFTSPFEERKRLLAETRARNPMLALAWLEKTWPEETAAHKAQFVELLRTRRSPMDETLLERAFADKKREVRLAALEVSLSVPGSGVGAQAALFFRERLAAALPPATREQVLKQTLPDMSDAALQPWMSLAANSGKEHWRSELLHFFIKTLPPADLPGHTGLDRETTAAALADAAGAAALLEALVRHGDATWTDIVLRQYCADFRHAVWQSKAMTNFLGAFAPEAVVFFNKTGVAIGHENESILRALENFDRPWTEPMLRFLLEQYHRAAFVQQLEVPGWHFAPALRTAAYRCLPADAVAAGPVRAYLNGAYAVRPREFEDFLAVIRFRQGVRQHISVQAVPTF